MNAGNHINTFNSSSMTSWGGVSTNRSSRLSFANAVAAKIKHSRAIMTLLFIFCRKTCARNLRIAPSKMSTAGRRCLTVTVDYRNLSIGDMSHTYHETAT